jgi:hypothetical protein
MKVYLRSVFLIARISARCLSVRLKLVEFCSPDVGEVRKPSRVLHSGRGVSAKTVTLLRAIRRTLESGMLPIYVDLRQWSGQAYTEWKETYKGQSERADFILRRFAIPRINPSELELSVPGIKKYLFIDSLNEVTSSVGQEIILALDDFITFNFDVSLIIADRLVRRDLPRTERWQLASTLPLEDDEIKSQLKMGLGSTEEFDRAGSSVKTLLSTPYFLDSLLRKRYTDFAEYFLKNASLTNDELSLSGRAAYKMYEIYRSRTFPLKAFEEYSTSEVIRKLIEAGSLCVEGNLSYFNHHLTHDFLAAFYLSQNKSTWNRDAFDVISFRASSFDALAIALEQLKNSDEADLFVRRIYDWNPYSPAYSVAEGIRHGNSHVSEEMIIVLLAMLVERRADLLLNTIRAANDALYLFPDEYGRPFTESKSLRGLVDFLYTFKSEKKWFVEWRDIFAQGRLVDKADLHLLQDEDSVLGWTYTNVLRRTNLSPEGQGEIRALSNHEHPSIRWRAVHVLGAFPDRRNLLILTERLDKDSDNWVRYGAMRSLIEMAARADDEIRNEAFSELSTRTDKIVGDRFARSAFESAIFIVHDKIPDNWLQLTFGILQKFFLETVNVEVKDHWTLLADRMANEYRTNDKEKR